MLSKLVDLTKQNPVMQVQLYKAMERYILGTKNCNDLEVAELVVMGLQDHVAYFKKQHNGRYPNKVRAALQAVYAAVSFLLLLLLIFLPLPLPHYMVISMLENIEEEEVLNIWRPKSDISLHV